MIVYGNHQFMPKGSHQQQAVYVPVSSEDKLKQIKRMEEIEEMKRNKPVVKVSIHDGTIIAHFSSAEMASKKTGIPRTTISSGCNRKTISSIHDFVWRFLDEYDPDEPFMRERKTASPLIGKNESSSLWFRSMRDVANFLNMEFVTSIKNHLDREGVFEHDGWSFVKCSHFNDGLGIERWSCE